jgi:hypothetical protein
MLSSDSSLSNYFRSINFSSITYNPTLPGPIFPFLSLPRLCRCIWILRTTEASSQTTQEDEEERVAGIQRPAATIHLCFAARRNPLRGKAGEPVSAPTGPDRTAAVIHYAIGDYAPTLRVGPHHTRAPPGRGAIRVHSP